MDPADDHDMGVEQDFVIVRPPLPPRYHEPRNQNERDMSAIEQVLGEMFHVYEDYTTWKKPRSLYPQKVKRGRGRTREESSEKRVHKSN